jgi:hypothetical protein
MALALTLLISGAARAASVTYDFTSICCGAEGGGILVGPDAITHGTITFNLPYERVGGDAPFSITTMGGSPLFSINGYDAADQLVFSTAIKSGSQSIYSSVKGGVGAANGNGTESSYAFSAATLSKSGIETSISIDIFGYSPSVGAPSPVYNSKGLPLPFTTYFESPVVADTEVEAVLQNANSGQNISNAHFSLGSLVQAPEMDVTGLGTGAGLLFAILAVLRGKRNLSRALFQCGAAGDGEGGGRQRSETISIEGHHSAAVIE